MVNRGFYTGVRQKLFVAKNSRTKYGNRKTIVDGITFDSKKEAERWCELRILERAGQIEQLERQKKFELIPTLEREDGSKERRVSYTADFAYYQGGRLVVEDSKGFRTPEYTIKRKLMLWRYGVTIRET